MNFIEKFKKKSLDKKLEKALGEFYNKLLLNQKPLEPEFQKVLDDHFWELLDES